MQRHKQVTCMEDYEKWQLWQLDIPSTIIANIVGALFIFVVLIFIIFTITFITNIDDGNAKLIALIVFMFSAVKLLSWVGYPTLEYKRRKEAEK